MLFSFSFILFVSGVLAFYSIINVKKVNELAEELILNESEELILLQDLRFNMSERLRLVNNYLLEGTPVAKDQFEANVNISKKMEGQILANKRNKSSEKEIKKIIESGTKWNEIMQKDVITVYDQGDKRQALLNLGSEQFKAENNMSALKKIADEKEKRVKELGNEIITNGNKVSLITTILTVIVAMVTILVAVLLSKSIYIPINRLSLRVKDIADGDFSKPKMEVTSEDEIGQLTKMFNMMVQDLRNLIVQASSTSFQVYASAEELTVSSEETSKGTEQITSSIQEVAASSNKQLASVNEATQTIEELNKNLDTLKQSVYVLEHSSLAVAEVSNKGNNVVEHAISQMNHISHSVSDVSYLIETLGKRSNEISSITEVITSLAEQTNLLALNAAIEAARAGEQGKGFAVVADEVRKLAVQSKDSSNQIVQLITRIQADTLNAIEAMKKSTKEVENGTVAVNEAGLSFKHINQSIQDIRNNIDSINAFVDNMSSSSKNVTSNIEVLTEIANINSTYSNSVALSVKEQLATIEEITASAQTLNTMALHLEEVLRKFKI
ncbi:methyl-accepting chemotaxis protein (plasmid) [Bacillus sp. 31A1R]|uniref:Methyl-accepting chemotaxis protein n=1 Tax=Robertmurraya mangrovi TaxID=3098077 RepID=A0ABU5IV12_9BACI|nr:methyl-accepting chemotaxis protein [Bacillus sp. 31A1R]MDZ5470975.1 methyl-accepting chemotaxis protein [Bacillus sp. 31A1R]